MNLFIEREFLDNFYIVFDEQKYQNVLKDLFSQYGDRNVYIDYDIDDFPDLIKDNELFSLMGNISPPDPVSNIKEFLFQKTNFDQDLIFMQNEESWFKEIRSKGGLCFSFDNYENQLKEIIENLHFEIDLSNGFEGWDFLNAFDKISFNELIVTDGFILSDKSNQKMDDNIIPILSSLIKDRKRTTEIKIFTRNLGPKAVTEEKINEERNKRLRLLNRLYAKYKVKFKIIIDHKGRNPYDFHDRIIQTNYSLTECGKGFNLSKTKKSNSEIRSKTIFDIYTYKRLKNHKKMQATFIEKLNK